MLTLIALAAFGATMLGGLFALRLKDRLHLILGFSAGAVVAVAFFDLLPEAIELSGGHAPISVFTMTAIGFVTYLVVDRLFLHHSHASEVHENHTHRGVVGASSLSFHSFLDGVGIGLAFQVSPAVGIIVAAAVLTHDFSDGINTVNLILKNARPDDLVGRGGARAKALRWLVVDALAPVLGIILTLFVSIPQETLGLLLGLFAGFFLYIGATDLIPESHHAHPTKWTTISTVLGVAVLYVAIRLAGI
jgi:ZIP family zinc transporter